MVKRMPNCRCAGCGDPIPLICITDDLDVVHYHLDCHRYIYGG